MNVSQDDYKTATIAAACVMHNFILDNQVLALADKDNTEEMYMGSDSEGDKGSATADESEEDESSVRNSKQLRNLRKHDNEARKDGRRKRNDISELHVAQ